MTKEVAESLRAHLAIAERALEFPEEAVKVEKETKDEGILRSLLS